MKMHLTKGSLMFAIRTPMSIGDFEGEFKGKYSYCIRVSVDQFGPLYLRYGDRVRIDKKLTNHLFIVTQIDQDPNSKPSVITLLIAKTTKEKVDFDLMKGSELILTRAYPSSYRNTNRPEQGQPESKIMSENKEKTFGMKAVGIDFNPSGDPLVNRIKMQSANLIDTLNELRGNVDSSAEVKRMCSVAITDIQSGQMWGVKAATWKD